VDPPTCSGEAVVDPGAQTITAGHIDSLDIQNGSWALGPGVYCIDNGMRLNGGSITGQDVTFYVAGGAVSWSGNATIRLDAPDDGDFAGMLVYQDPGNTDRATLNGSSGSYIQGTIFAPNAEVQVNGTGGADGFHSQIIGYRVDLSGTADLHVVYDPQENFVLREPGKVELTE
jgi:hypothetical protein